MPNLLLYYMSTCPFCIKVLRYMQDHDIEIPMKNILDHPKYRQELLEIGGKTQVPCLIIDGKALYESDDIIQWMKNNLQA